VIKLKVCIGIVALFCILPATTMAQQSGVEDSVDNNDRSIEEIVVTARKRLENIQDVPIAISAISGSQLEEIGAADISELQVQVPNLTIYPSRSASNTATLFIRGVGQIDAAWGAEQGVGVYLDDVYFARPQTALLDIFDVERIEVLRGPQGTLYGRNTIGGAVKYISRPFTDDTHASFDVTSGEFGRLDVKASVSGSLLPGKLRGKLAVASLQRDGYGNNLFTGQEVSNKDTKAYRLALEWLAADNLNVRLNIDEIEDKSRPLGFTRLEANPFCPLLGISCEPLNLFDVESSVDSVNNSDSKGMGLVVDWEINERWSLKSITAQRESSRLANTDFDTTPIRLSDIIGNNFEEQTTQEFQLSYNGGNALQGILGLYYLDGTAGGRSDNVLFESFFVSIEGFTDTESFALYGNGSYAITEDLKINFGVRITEEEKRVVNLNSFYSDDSFTTITGPLADFDESQEFSSVAPNLGLQFDFSEDVMGYASLSRGFRSGGFNIRATNPDSPKDSVQPFDEETLTMAEVGIKAQLADQRLRINAAVFHGDYKDIQVSSFTSLDSDGDGIDDVVTASFINAGEATLRGLEAGFDWNSRAVEWFGISGNFSLLDSDPKGFLDKNNDGFVDSQVLSNHPEFSGMISLNVNFPAFGGNIKGNLSYSYRDDSVLTNEGGPDPRDPTKPLAPLVQPSFGMVDANLGWSSASSNWKFYIHGRNLSDEEYLLTGFNLPVIGIVNGLFGPPRAIAATISYDL